MITVHTLASPTCERQKISEKRYASTTQPMEELSNVSHRNLTIHQNIYRFPRSHGTFTKTGIRHMQT